MHRSQKEYYDKKLVKRVYNEGDKVYLKTMQPNDLAVLFDDPLEVIQTNHPNYQLKHYASPNSIIWAHFNNIYCGLTYSRDPVSTNKKEPTKIRGSETLLEKKRLEAFGGRVMQHAHIFVDSW